MKKAPAGGRRVVTGAPGAETARFAMPARVKMRRFDEITVVFYTGDRGKGRGWRWSRSSWRLGEGWWFLDTA